MDYKRRPQRKRTSKRNIPTISYQGKILLGGLGCIIVLGLGIFGVDSFVNPEIKEVSMQFVNDQHTKHLVVAKSEQMTTPEETKGQSYGGTGNQAVEGINGDWKTDSVGGYKVSWFYLCNVYEASGRLSTVQSHYNCKCTPENFDVPKTYSMSTVAFGPFQFDSKYSASGFFQALKDAGYPGFDNLIGLTNEQYLTYDVRKAAHGALLAAEQQGPTKLLATAIEYAKSAYLPEEQLAQLEQVLGKSRNDIPESVIAGMFANNIFLGKAFGTKYIKNINSSMSDEQLVNTLYNTVKAYPAKKVNAEWYQARHEAEKSLALRMLDSSFDGYAAQDSGTQGIIHWGSMLQLSGY